MLGKCGKACKIHYYLWNCKKEAQTHQNDLSETLVARGEALHGEHLRPWVFLEQQLKPEQNEQRPNRHPAKGPYPCRETACTDPRLACTSRTSPEAQMAHQPFAHQSWKRLACGRSIPLARSNCGKTNKPSEKDSPTLFQLWLVLSVFSFLSATPASPPSRARWSPWLNQGAKNDMSCPLGCSMENPPFSLHDFPI